MAAESCIECDVAIVGAGFAGALIANELGKARRKVVILEAGARNESLTIINSGLKAGERIITDGQYKLQRNVPVTYTAPATAGAGPPRP